MNDRLNPNVANDQLDAWAAWTSRPIEYALNSAFAWMRAVEAASQIQLQAAHALRARHENAAERLVQEPGTTDLSTLQNDLLRTDAQEATYFWQRMFETMFRTQSDMISALQSLMNPRGVAVETPPPAAAVEAPTPAQWTSALGWDQWIKALNQPMQMAQELMQQPARLQEEAGSRDRENGANGNASGGGRASAKRTSGSRRRTASKG